MARTKPKDRRQAQSAARKAPTVSLAWDHGAMGQANRIGLVEEQRETDGQNPNGVTGMRRVDLLEYWLKRGTITPSGYSAAVMLRNAYETTQRGPDALPENDRVQSSPKPDHAIAISIDRISKFEAIMRHVIKEDREIVRRCVLDGWHPGKLPQYKAMNSRAGLRHLEQALDRMAKSLERK